MTDREVLDDIYEQILDAWYNKPKGYELLDWGMNFKHDTERLLITQHFEPSQELMEKFTLGFENTKDLEHALSDLFWARAENNLEDFIMLDLPEPDTSFCNER